MINKLVPLSVHALAVLHVVLPAAVSMAPQLPSVQRFMVLSTQRSGSNWFEEVLSTHPQILSHGEDLVPKPNGNTDLGFLNYNCKRGPMKDWSTYENCLEVIFNSKTPCAGRHYSPGDKLVHCGADATKEEALARGFLIKYNHIPEEFLPDLMGYLKRKAIIIIHLERDSSIELALSRFNIWSGFRQTVHKVPIKEFRQFDAYHRDVATQWKTSLSYFGIPTYCVTYEGLQQSGFNGAVWPAILRFLRVDESVSLHDRGVSESKHAKIRTTCEQRVSRTQWNELYEHGLRGTPSAFHCCILDQLGGQDIAKDANSTVEELLDSYRKCFPAMSMKETEKQVTDRLRRAR